MFKYYGTEHNKRRHELMVAASELMDLHGMEMSLMIVKKILQRGWLEQKVIL
ncbi:MAG: hypothetical protein Ct9H90mP6_11480 [Gammaproteobacteria bacterium]|nr:MAG: hypothetical protein Ct9H90mP6_11480 [Gammaproteobacteria bacterium]